MLPVAILAGGLASRLHPITERVPKALVDVAGRPFVLRQLDLLRQQGLRRVVLCVGFLGELIRDRVGDGVDVGMEIEYSFDGPGLLGTGGALRRALPLLGERFFVLYGDSYLPIDFGAVEKAFASCGLPALMTILKNDGQWDKSNVEFEDGRLVRYDKRNPSDRMTYIDFGLGALSAEALMGGSEGATEKQLDLGDLYRSLSERGLLAGHEVFGRFYEIGSFSGLKDAIAYFRAAEES
jgi:MurNAc alpha-1-phosphate uridylyltransferase